MPQTKKTSRRDFITRLSAAACAGGLMSASGLLKGESMDSTETAVTCRDVIGAIVKASSGNLPEGTVDTVKAGDPSRKVTGITTTFLATCEVIRKSADRNNNLIITHEPVFYNHLDRTDWLQGDPVYGFKKKMLDDTGAVVWRCHDTIHSMKPDGITLGMRKKLGWEAYADPRNPELYHLPETTLAGLAGSLKSAFSLAHVRSIGDPAMPVRTVGYLAGAPGGTAQIEFLENANPDAVVCGEIHEWETSEYVRDARYSGKMTGLILIGHVSSEEAGMAWLAEWLKSRFPGLRVDYIPAGNPFVYL
jgi:putative NIF3 family GTP cyclohydrolase 1 type 2